MNNYLIILTAAVTSYSLKLIPVLFLNKFQLSKDNSILKFFNYAAYAMIGSIIYIISLGNMNQTDTFVINYISVLKIFIILLTFLISCRTKKTLTNFSISLMIYAVLFYWFFSR